MRVPCSSVWTATIARVGAFCSIFRDLQDLCTFAPLWSQNFSKESSKIFARMKWNSISFQQISMKFAIFLQNFDEILLEFHAEMQEIANIQNFWIHDCQTKARKMSEISGIWTNFRKFHFSFHFFNPIPCRYTMGKCVGEPPHHHRVGLHFLHAHRADVGEPRALGLEAQNGLTPSARSDFSRNI